MDPMVLIGSSMWIVYPARLISSLAVSVGQRVSKSSPSGTTLFAYDEQGHLIVILSGDCPNLDNRSSGCWQTSGRSVCVRPFNAHVIRTARSVSVPRTARRAN